MTAPTADETEKPRCGLTCHRVDGKGLCHRCREMTTADLQALAGLWEMLHDLGDIPPCTYPHAKPRLNETTGKPILGDRGQQTGERVPCTCAPLSAGPLMPGQAGGDKVSGSREAPLGVRVSVLSFTAPPNNHRLGITEAWRDADDLGLQVGERSLLDTLCAWGRLIVEEHPDRLVGPVVPRNGGTAARVAACTGWLLARRDWPYEQLWCDDYAGEIRQAADHARRLLGMYDEQPELKAGVPCRRCLSMSLVRYPGEADIVCARVACQQVLRPDEYEAWARLYATNPRTAVNDEERAAWLLETAAELDAATGLHRHASMLRSWAARQGDSEAPRGPLRVAVPGDAPEDLLSFLAARLAEDGDPACYDMAALRSQGWLVRMLAVDYSGHAEYREEWRPAPLPLDWEETG